MLFTTEGDGIGLSILRQPIGTSDYRAKEDYTYDDVNYDDTSLSQFSINKDKNYIIPLL